MNNVSIGSVLNSIVPISRFNKGEASKIFDEVDKSGYKIVVKNNKPTCVIITPEKYQEMIEEIEDYHLYLEAEKRMANVTENDFISSEELLKELNITKEQLDNANDVEIEL